MSEKLYVFETVLSNGTCVLGKAGLPYDDMVKLRERMVKLRERMADDSAKVPRIVPAPDNTRRLDVDMSRKGGQGAESLLWERPQSLLY